MKCKNESGGTLIMPGGEEIAAGGEVTLTKDQKENHAVKLWLDRGALVEAKAAKKSDD